MSMHRQLLRRVLPVALLAATASVLSPFVSAEDIDIYAPPISAQPGGTPDLMILLDTASAWNGAVTFTCPPVNGVQPTSSNNAGKDAGFVQCALYQAVYDLGQSTSLSGNINVGLMRYNIKKDGTANTGQTFSGNGATLKSPSVMGSPGPAPQPLPLIGGPTSAGVTNLNSLLTTIVGLDRTADGSNNENMGTALQEVWAYYAAKVGLSNESYTNLVNSDYCRKNFHVFIAGAFTNTKAGANVDWLTPLQAAGATSAQQAVVTIPAPNNKYQGQGGGPEWARFMFQNDLSGGKDPSGIENIVTYTIVVTDGSNPNLVAYMQAMASNGGGKAFIVNVNDANPLQELVNALLQIFGEVEAVNSVFSSVSLPLSVNNQGTYQNQFFYGMFRPESSFLPRWWGNLKQYQAGFSGGGVALVDSAGNLAINNNTGFITQSAVSFWTTAANTVGTAQWPSTGYWYNTWQANGQSFGAGGAFDSPDGEKVEKGAVAEVLRGTNLASDVRTVYTCSNSTNACSTTALDKFATSNATLIANANTAFGTSSSTVPSTSTLVNWVRGEDLANNETEPGPYGLTPTLPNSYTSTARPSIHGDVLHSQPAVINYGGTTGVVVFYGSNDGMYHAINGNETASITSGTVTVPAGGELWSFVAPEFFPRFARLYNNSPSAKFGANPPNGSTPKDYFFDGSTAVFIDNRPASTTYGSKYIYLTPRRGGSFIYAFDVTNPLAPKFLWEKTKADLPELGEAWSQPIITQVSVAGQTNPVLIMGGGYDTAEDSDPPPASDSVGRAIYVIDAVTGTPLWAAQQSCSNAPKKGTCVAVAGMTHSIPSTITLLDRNGDGYTDRLYATDVGGNIWRVDLPLTGGFTAWSVSQLASLGGTGNNARKFFYPPDVETTPLGYDVVVASSGDREHPLYSASPGTASQVQNAFFSIQDPNTGTSVPTTWTPITESNLAFLYTSGQTPVAYTSTTPSSSGGTSQGFFINYQASEKGVNAPLIVSGYTYFGTNTPTQPSSTPVCQANLGIARGYAVSFLTGLGLNQYGFVPFNGGGMPPSPVFGFVQIGTGASMQTVGVLIGGGNQASAGAQDGSSALGAQQISPPSFHTRKRTYWYQEGVK
ncbi:pilus assembly protein [Dyella silvae]|uniref:pilus assembly protein n=1 Tax=Dyella silvae TaxID=2994424 RepID=UPI0022646364|nr:PilC/PilY family type IV pilus protein [Dyella silvae]